MPYFRSHTENVHYELQYLHPMADGSLIVAEVQASSNISYLQKNHVKPYMISSVWGNSYIIGG